MTTVTTAQLACTTEAVQTVWREVTKAAELGNFIVVSFDDPHSIRKAIWVSYARSPSVYIGQGQTYEARLWPDIYTVFELLYTDSRGTDTAVWFERLAIGDSVTIINPTKSN